MGDKINRMDKKDGGFMTISNDVMYDKNLSSTAKELLILMLNNSSEWKINTTYFGNKLGWSPSRLSKATKLLIELGYLERTMTANYNGRGTTYKYIVNEVPTFGNRSSDTEVLIQKFDNQTSVTQVREQYVNNTNLDNTNLNKTKLNNTNRAEAVTTKDYNINKELNINIENNMDKKIEIKEEEKTASVTEPIKEIERKKYFFNKGERPIQERTIEFVVEKGYPKEVGIKIHSELLKKGFKGKDGNGINYLDSYISSMLEDESKNPVIKQDVFIEVEKEFVRGVDMINRKFVAKWKNKAPNHDLNSGLIYMKQASKIFFNNIGRTKSEYQNFINKFEAEHGVQAPSTFKKRVLGNKEEIIQSGVGEIEREEKVIYVDKDVPTEEIEKKGTSYLDR